MHATRINLLDREARPENRPASGSLRDPLTPHQPSPDPKPRPSRTRAQRASATQRPGRYASLVYFYGFLVLRTIWWTERPGSWPCPVRSAAPAVHLDDASTVTHAHVLNSRGVRVYEGSLQAPAVPSARSRTHLCTAAPAHASEAHQPHVVRLRMQQALTDVPICLSPSAARTTATQQSQSRAQPRFNGCKHSMHNGN